MTAETTLVDGSAPVAEPTARPWLAWVISGVLLLFVALALSNALANLIGMQRIAASLGTGLTVTGWIVLLAGVLLPVIAVGCALLVSRGRPWIRALALLVTVGAVAAWQLELLYLIPQGAYLVGA